MNVSTFDTLTAAKALREAGFEARQAEAPRFRGGRVAGVMRHAVGADRDALATKADVDARFAALRADIDARFAALRADLDARFADIDARFAKIEARFTALRAEARADLYRALWVQGAGLVAVMIALNAALIAALELFR